MRTEHVGAHDLTLRQATTSDQAAAWTILQHAIEQRRLDGSAQWQDGYPNPDTIREDLLKGQAHVLEAGGELLLYAAVIFDPEPAYAAIEGQWLTNGPYLVLHRVAASPKAKGMGIGTSFFRMVEDLCRRRGVPSIKVDTNFDNTPMLRIMDKLGYTYCGEVYFRGSARRAYEKVLS
ncbi:MAG: GNAT family N-acetyltransferase [Flavobacteriales bacterium]|nr:GNAT family N-acetyltransferase [Flavobacteriales bacterium]